MSSMKAWRRRGSPDGSKNCSKRPRRPYEHPG
jgi:hypothetical protein